ncbi:BREX-1 system adenine-specific DNA-methyltransferase PglX [Pseudomonas putida]|nr:BREX-1 system adenine-specific DNA-methyltransferase PglX [Pseudomonas putida]EKT4513734.1 BREX-1 system adenine-specific DNA-methyltransferase PglX [Pseudomonas putida]
MNTNNVRNYAPKARTAFIAAMTKRAALFGIRESSIPAMGIVPLEQKGDIALIGDHAFPVDIIRPRAALVKKVEQLGFAQAIEQAAYSWFNRLCAIRYMELKDYLDHGRRVLSAADGSAATPQILDDCLEIDVPGLDKQRITELKLDGTKDEELYRELLLAQCHALHQAMPFLFEAVDDATELLLPDNLTKTDSLIRELVSAIPEEDWADIEIIGWLYQFYISEKKDQVIGNVVKSEDIPAATQLFTPNWIVKYMVQNSLGAQWLATYSDSPLKAQMEYYIEPVEQTDNVKAQLAAITPDALNPEELTLIDPASGSGHILVEAYDLFKAIYLERGYRQRDVAQLILQKNLFGLDIDGRAAQLTGFALMMKGRADDRRLFERRIKLNVMALVDSTSLDPDVLTSSVKLADYGLQLGDLTELKRLFEHATTFGSLIHVPAGLVKKLPGLKQICDASTQDLFVADELKNLGPLVRQAELLEAQYDAVVANPPYMGSGGMNDRLKKYAKNNFPNAKSDLFACFIERGYMFAKASGHNSMVTMESWMFLSSYEKFRHSALQRHTIRNLAHFPYDGKQPTAMGINFGVAVMTSQNTHIAGYLGHFCCSRHYELNDNGVPIKFPTPNERQKFVGSDDFKSIPGSPIAYWVSLKVIDGFSKFPPLSNFVDTRIGLITGENERYIRNWSEVDFHAIGLGLETREAAEKSGRKWFPQSKGGDYRKWFGNNTTVLDWSNDGHELQTRLHSSGTRTLAHNFNLDRIFDEAVTWTKISSGAFSPRFQPSGYLFNDASSNAFPTNVNSYFCLALLCAATTQPVISALNPTLNYLPGTIGSVPTPTEQTLMGAVQQIAERAVNFARDDWDSYERSWDFQSLPILTASSEPVSTLESSYIAWIARNRNTIAELQRLEEDNNRLFIEAYGLAEELTPDVPIEQITLTINPAYRYSGKLSEAELWTRFREDSMRELVSFGVGCMLGRYSLDEPGLIYAHSGNHGFDPSRYTSFPADADGILPLTDYEWFADDAANRLVEFVSVAWDKTHLEANLRFLADNLSPKKTESSHETLRRYLCDNFFKDHLQSYKKRPIYWLFSSGKHKAFQCLIYLHRYNEGTLARMRTEYVIPLTAKFNTYATKLEQDIEASTSTAEKKRLEKELAALHNQQAELATFDEKLRHYADQRISLELDEGVKVNYGKFGDLLAEVKAVAGDKVE